MFSFLYSLLNSIFKILFTKKKNVIFTMLLLKKENEIYCRYLSLQNKKQENHLWGCKKIANELKKINIEIHYTTVNRIISTFRKQGLVKPNGSWKRFLKMHWNPLFAMDFMTVDTLFGKRLYMLIILELKRLVESKLDWSCATLTARLCSLICSPMLPGMNAYVERLNGTIRREALDHFLLFSEKQVRKIISEFVEYYNNQRMHQGINKIPDSEIVESSGVIKKMKILSGLHVHYYRSSA